MFSFLFRGCGLCTKVQSCEWNWHSTQLDWPSLITHLLFRRLHASQGRSFLVLVLVEESLEAELLMLPLAEDNCSGRDLRLAMAIGALRASVVGFEDILIGDGERGRGDPDGQGSRMGWFGEDPACSRKQDPRLPSQPGRAAGKEQEVQMSRCRNWSCRRSPGHKQQVQQTREPTKPGGAYREQRQERAAACERARGLVRRRLVGRRQDKAGARER